MSNGNGVVNFATPKSLISGVDINSAWETIRENIKMLTKESPGYYELKKHNPRFNERSTKLLVKRKQARLQCF
jgi:hypothetical protein